MNDVLSGLTSIMLNLVSSAILVVIVWFRNEIKHALLLASRYVKAKVSGRRYVLIWNDDAPELSATLGKKLSSRHPTLEFRTLETPSRILEYPLVPTCVAGVVLIDCDVTPLAETQATRQRIEGALERYLVRGGGLIGTHDLIYRRSRAHSLQRLFGCQLTDFARQASPVGYRVSAGMENHPLAHGLPETFTLDDGEVCWGEWAPDVAVVFHTDDSSAHPLVVGRDVRAGRVVWLNSADHTLAAAPALALPQAGFVSLVGNALDWFSEGDGARAACNRETRTTSAVIAHRGRSGDEAENSLAAFRASVDRGVESVELDVRRTRDGSLVVNHDATTHGLRIADTDLATLLKQENAPALLSDILDVCRSRCVVDIEVKEPGYEEELVELVNSVLVPGEYVYTSFDDQTVARLKILSPGTACGLLLGRGSPRNVVATRLSELFPVRRLRACHADFVAPAWQLLRFGLLTRMRRSGYPVYVWTVNDHALLAKLTQDDRIAAVITDVPLDAVKIRNQCCLGSEA